MRKLLVIAFSFLLSVHLFGQQATIIVHDDELKVPVPSAHLCFESNDKKQTMAVISGSDGRTVINIQSQGKLAVSCLGYQSQVIDIEPGKQYQVYLKRTLFEVDEVVVTGQAIAQTADKSIYQVQVIGSQKIADKGANNLSDALSGELSVSTVNNGILGKGISLLGLSGENVKILVDGIPIIGRQNGNLDLEQINITNIDHIEMIEGPMSVIYGSNALGGVINIISKKSSVNPLLLRINGYYENVGNYNLDALVNVKKLKHNLSIDGGRKFFDGYRFSDQYRSFDFRPKQQYFANASYGFQAPKLALKYTQELFFEQLRNPGNIDFIYALDEYHYTKRLNSKFFADYNPDSTSCLSFSGAYSYYNKSKITRVKNMVTLNEATSTDTASNDTAFFDNLFFRGTYSRLSKKAQWLTGIDGSMEKGNGKRLDATKHIDEYAAFASIKYQVAKPVSIQVGTRAIYNTRYSAPLVYSLNALWNISPATTVRASVGSGFRSPSIKELYLNFVDVNHNVHGNPDLDAESSVNYNLIFTQSFGKKKNNFEWKWQLYHNLIKNKIDLAVDENSATEAHYINIGGISKTLGASTQITWKKHPGITVNAGFVYRGESKLAHRDQYTFTPDANLNVTYFNVRYKYRLHANYKYFGKETQYTTDSDRESWIASYQLVNVGASRPFFNDKLVVGLGIKNLFNYQQIEQYGSMGGVHSGSGSGQMDVSWGRSYYVSLNYRFSKLPEL